MLCIVEFYIQRDMCIYLWHLCYAVATVQRLDRVGIRFCLISWHVHISQGSSSKNQNQHLRHLDRYRSGRCQGTLGVLGSICWSTVRCAHISFSIGECLDNMLIIWYDMCWFFLFSDPNLIACRQRPANNTRYGIQLQFNLALASWTKNLLTFVPWKHIVQRFVASAPKRCWGDALWDVGCCSPWRQGWWSPFDCCWCTSLFARGWSRHLRSDVPCSVQIRSITELKLATRCHKEFGVGCIGYISAVFDQLWWTIAIGLDESLHSC